MEHPDEGGVEYSDLMSSSDQRRTFIGKHQMGSKRWFRLFLEGFVQAQKHIPQISVAHDRGFKSSRDRSIAM